MRKADFLIIGQGLAGTNLALHLLQKDQSILIVDKLREVTSSKVAAGLMNPVTGRRFAKTWLADEIFPFAKKHYQNLEKRFETSFFNVMPINRYFGSIDDQNTWMGRSTEPELKEYIGNYDDINAAGINAELGGTEIIGGGWLDTDRFLRKLREYFISSNLIVDDTMDYSDLSVRENEISWKNEVLAKHVVFCEGFRNKDNPFFNWLPYTFAKGEILDVETKGLSDRVIHNKNGFILPLGNDQFKVGATFRWNEMDELPTERSLIELKEKLKSLSNLDFQILNQKASIRPTTKDRRPFIGAHPEYPNIYNFNGFGSKGVTLTPFLANHFAEVLVDGKDLNEEVNLIRYYKK